MTNDEFIYILSHDVRGSARALIEIPKWIKEDLSEQGIGLPEDVSENLELMDRHARRLDKMLVDLLTYSRVGRDGAFQPLNIASALQDARSKISLPPNFEVLKNLDCVQLWLSSADASALFLALLSNFAKHHNRERGVIQFSTFEENGRCILLIEDDGPGIPKNHWDRVLRVATTLKSRDEVEGSGMGLATIRKIIDHYGGQLDFEQPVNLPGTRLRLEIPCQASPPKDAI